MRRELMMALAGAAFAAANPAYATPKPNPPTLHGFCSLTATCTDNGTNTPTGVNPPQFAFAASGGAATGTLLIDILAVNAAAPGPFTITGALSGTASLFSSTPWTSGQLDSYLGISASPTEPYRRLFAFDANLPAERNRFLRLHGGSRLDYASWHKRRWWYRPECISDAAGSGSRPGFLCRWLPRAKWRVWRDRQ